MSSETLEGAELERELFVTRKVIEKLVAGESWADDFYVCSFSNRTIVYKGMLRSVVLGEFYLDLKVHLPLCSFLIHLHHPYHF